MKSSLLPNNQTHQVFDPSAALGQARDQYRIASQAHTQARGLWHKRIIQLQYAIAGLIFLRWFWSYSLVGAIFIAILTWLVLGLLHLFVGFLVRADKKRYVSAKNVLSSARQYEVETYLKNLNKGRYQWIRRGGDYLGLLPDAGLLYYFGSMSKDKHSVFDPPRTILEVRVTAEQHVNETTTNTTNHNRRVVVMPSKHLGMAGKGKSTTTTTTQKNITTTYTLEIQLQLAKGQQPSWITLPFGFDGKDAENWKVLVSQLR